MFGRNICGSEEPAAYFPGILGTTISKPPTVVYFSSGDSSLIVNGLDALANNDDSIGLLITFDETSPSFLS